MAPKRKIYFFSPEIIPRLSRHFNDYATSANTHISLCHNLSLMHKCIHLHEHKCKNKYELHCRIHCPDQHSHSPSFLKLLPFSPPVFIYLRIEGHRPGHEIDPTNHSTCMIDDFIMLDCHSHKLCI